MRKGVPRISTVDGAIAVALTIAAQIEIWGESFNSGDSGGSKAILAVTTLVITLSLALRRVAPLLVAAIAGLASLAQGILTTPSQSVSYLIALLLVAYSVAAHGDLPHALAGALCLAAGVAAQADDLADWAFALLVLGGAWGAGVAINRRASAIRLLDHRARLLERERDQAAAQERARIARELHDIVSHRVTTMVVQAQAGEAVLERDPAAVARSLRSIDESGRAALGELRSLLGLLRDEEGGAELEPSPGVAELEELVGRARQAGTPTVLRVEGEPVTVAPGVGLTVYRIAQEALTNVVKHAAQAATEVVLSYEPSEIVLTVSDRGPGPNGNGDGGHGLVGMRERVAVYGGSLEAGPGETGGFRLAVRLPLEGYE